MGYQSCGALALVVVLTAAMSACSAEGPQNPPGSFSVRIGQEPFSAGNLSDPSNVSKPDVPGAVVVRDRRSSCVSAAATSAAFALTAVDVLVGLSPEGGGVAAGVTWKLSAPPPPYGGTLLVFTATSADGLNSLELRYRTANGIQMEYSLMEGDSTTSLYGQPVTTSAGEIRAVIPSEAVIKLGAGFHWSAQLIRNIYPVNSCPPAEVRPTR